MSLRLRQRPFIVPGVVVVIDDGIQVPLRVFGIERDRFRHQRNTTLPFPYQGQTQSVVRQKVGIIGIEGDRPLPSRPEPREIAPIEQRIREHQLGGRVPRFDLDRAIRCGQGTLTRIVELRSRIEAKPMFLRVDVRKNSPRVRIVGIELDGALQAGAHPGMLLLIEQFLVMIVAKDTIIRVQTTLADGVALLSDPLPRSYRSCWQRLPTPVARHLPESQTHWMERAHLYRSLTRRSCRISHRPDELIV